MPGAADAWPGRRAPARVIVGLGAMLGACFGALGEQVVAAHAGRARPPQARRRRAWVLAVVLAGAGAVLARRRVPPWSLPAAAVLVVGLAVLAAIDLETHRLPRTVVYSTGLTAATLMLSGAAVSGRWTVLVGPAAAAAAAGLALWAVWRCSTRVGVGLGYGDVRVAVLVGLAAGWSGPPAEALLLAGTALLVASGMAALEGVLRVACGAPGRVRFAFGPSLAVGGTWALLVGHATIAAAGLR